VFQRELDAALRAATFAGDYLKTAYEAFVPIPDAPPTISTEADRTSQDAILRILSATFPDDAYLAEEATDTLKNLKREDRRTWIVDPIDGTRGFAKKNGEFSVMVGLVVDGRVVVGVVLEPGIDRVTYASLSEGCWTKTGTKSTIRCAVGSAKELHESRLVVSHLKKGAPSPMLDAIRPIALSETYSAGVKLAMVARGESDLYIIDPKNPYFDWDVCAGDILVTEAGGRVTRINGASLTYPTNARHQSGLLATNGQIHDKAVAALDGCFGS
jgi:3'(2'), 5'-bisphosphate nucleotidase